MSNTVTNYLTADMVGLWVGLVGLIIAGYQTYSAHSAKRMYRNGCRIRVRDASDKAKRLADNLAELCMVAHSEKLYTPIANTPSATRAYAELHRHIGAALDVGKDWVRFCARLNEEHQDEFKESALSDKQLHALEEVRRCLVELESEHALDGEGYSSDRPRAVHS